MIEPVLAAEEWAARRKVVRLPDMLREEVFWEPGDLQISNNAFEAMGVTGPMVAAVLAAANDALPDGDPHKLTWEDVALLRNVAAGDWVWDGQDEYLSAPTPDEAVRLRDLADRIAALLPPRP